MNVLEEGGKIIIYSPFILFKALEESALRKSKFCFLFLYVSFALFMWYFCFFNVLSTRDSEKLLSGCLRENFYLASSIHL